MYTKVTGELISWRSMAFSNHFNCSGGFRRRGLASECVSVITPRAPKQFSFLFCVCVLCSMAFRSHHYDGSRIFTWLAEYVGIEVDQVCFLLPLVLCYFKYYFKRCIYT